MWNANSRLYLKNVSGQLNVKYLSACLSIRLFLNLNLFLTPSPSAFLHFFSDSVRHAHIYVPNICNDDTKIILFHMGMATDRIHIPY